jgi:hypothetical protein
MSPSLLNRLTYTIADFARIYEDESIPVPNKSIQDIFASLEKELAPYIPVEQATEHAQHTNITKIDRSSESRRSSHRRHGGGRSQPTLTDEDWSAIRNFKTTVIDKKEGVDKKINDIRLAINKISNKQFDTQCSSIIEQLNQLVSESDEHATDALERVAKAIFDIASTNKFYSEMYADLYKELIPRFAIFGVLLQSFIDSFLQTIDNIQYMDPNVDYDRFCEYTKENDRRKAMSMFIVNLLKRGLLDGCAIVKTVLQLHLIQAKYIDESDRVNEVDEITEMLFIFMSQCGEVFGGFEEWTDLLVPGMIAISTMKNKEHPSLSSRTIFKCRDLVEKIR